MSAYYARANSYSRSYNAHVAENEGRFPATLAAREWGFKSPAELRRWVRTSEWHHVGKFAACVDYYDVPSWMEGITTLQEIRGLGKSLTKRGKQLIMRPLVTRIIASNLACDEPYTPKCNRKSREQRRDELAKRHGVSFGLAFGPELSDRGAVIYAACEKARLESELRAARLKQFADQIKRNLAFRDPSLPEEVRARRRRIRLAHLKSQHGNFSARAAYKLLRRDSLPFSSANFLAARARLSS